MAHALVLENAGTIVLYTKPCFSSRLYCKVAGFGALVSEEQGAQHGANLFEGDLRCNTYAGGFSWLNLSVVLPYFGSTTEENTEGTS